MPQKAGRRVDYHGRRAPYFHSVDATLPNMRSDLRAMHDSIRLDLSEHFSLFRGPLLFLLHDSLTFLDNLALALLPLVLELSIV